VLVDTLCIRVGIDSLDEFVESLKVKSQVKIVDKCLLLVSDVDEGSVQGRKNLLYLSEIYISYGKVMTWLDSLFSSISLWFSINAIETSVEFTSTIRSFTDSIRNFSDKNISK